MLEEYENISVSYDFIYKHLTKVGIISPKARKKTKRQPKKNILQEQKRLENKTEKEIETIINQELSLDNAHPRGGKPKYFGEIIEMDGYIHLWFGDKKTCLHLATDKATNTIVGGYFDNQETLN